MSGKEQGRLSSRTKSRQAAAREQGRRWESPVARWGCVTGFPLYSEYKEKPLESCKQGRDKLF